MLILLLSSAVHEASAEFREETITGHEGAATDIKADQRYDSGVRVRDPALGISFVIPEEWRGGASPSSNLFFLIPDAKRGGIGLVVMFDQTTPQELADHMNEPQVLEEGFILHPTTSAAVSGDRITASYHAGENIGRAQAVFGPAHNAIVYLFTGSKDQAEYYDALLDRIAASTRFTTMDPAGLVKQWEDLLAGMALTYVEHDSSGDAGGDNRSTVWNLCRDGRFTYSHSSHAAVQVPGADVPDTSEDHRRGTWRVEAAGGNALLILTEEQGAVASHTVAYDGDKMYVDEQRVVRAKSEDCP